MITTKPISQTLGVVVSGVDIRAPVSEAERAEIVRLFNTHGLLVFRDTPLDKTQLIAATRIFGEPQVHPLNNILDTDFPAVTVLSTHGTRGDVQPDPDELVGRIDWHTDQAYVTVPNRGGVMIAAEIPPEDGATGFIDMHSLYDALDEATKTRIEGLSIVQSWRHAQETIRRNPGFRTDEGAKVLEEDRFPDLVYPLVQEHPVNGVKVLFVPPLWSSEILGVDAQEGRDLLEHLLQHVRNPQFAYWHSYLPGDVVVWDNWRMMHAASGTKGRYRRTMHRTVIAGGPEIGAPLSRTPAAAEVVAAAVH
jgi:taurine dioxygenase